MVRSSSATAAGNKIKERDSDTCTEDTESVRSGQGKQTVTRLYFKPIISAKKVKKISTIAQFVLQCPDREIARNIPNSS